MGRVLEMCLGTAGICENLQCQFPHNLFFFNLNPSDQSPKPSHVMSEWVGWVVEEPEAD